MCMATSNPLLCTDRSSSKKNNTTTKKQVTHRRRPRCNNSSSLVVVVEDNESNSTMTTTTKTKSSLLLQRSTSCSCHITSQQSQSPPSRRKGALATTTDTNKRGAMMKKQVSFGDVYESPQTYTLTSTAKKRMWYNDAEIQNLQTRAMWMIEKRIPFDETQDSLRGLETYLEKYQQEKSDEGTTNKTSGIEHNTRLLVLEHYLLMNSPNSDNVVAGAASLDDSMSSFASSLSGDDSARMGGIRARRDSEEARKVYLEDMDPETVALYFKCT